MSQDSTDNTGNIVHFPGDENDPGELATLVEAILDPLSDAFIGASCESIRLLRSCLREADAEGSPAAIQAIEAVALRFLRVPVPAPVE